jgi:hypothetical protein
MWLAKLFLAANLVAYGADAFAPTIPVAGLRRSVAPISRGNVFLRVGSAPTVLRKRAPALRMNVAEEEDYDPNESFAPVTIPENILKSKTLDQVVIFFEKSNFLSTIFHFHAPYTMFQSKSRTA